MLLAGALVGLVAGFSPLAAAGLFAAGVVLALAFARPTVLVALIFGTVVFAALADTGIAVATIPVTPSKLVVALALVLWTAHAVARRKPLVRWHPVLTGLLVLTFATGLSVLFAPEVRLRGLHELIPAALLTVLVALVRTALSGEDLQPLYRVLGVLALLAFATGLAAPDDQLRASGTFGDANFWATVVLMLTPLLVGGLVDDPSRWGRGLALLLVALLPVAILRTASRAAFVTLLALSPGVLLLFRRRPGLLLAGAGLALPLAPLLVDLDRVFERLSTLVSAAKSGPWIGEGSLEMRYALQARAYELFVENPVLGVGAGNFAPESDIVAGDGQLKVTHNTYLQVASESGIVGLLALGLVGLLVARTFLLAWRAAPDGRHRRRVGGAALGLGAYALMAATLNLLHMPLAWLLLGIALAVCADAGGE